MNIEVSKNIEVLKEGLTIEGKKRIDQHLKDIKKAIQEANKENINAMRNHLMSSNNELQLNNDLACHFGNLKYLFDLRYVNYIKENGKMSVKYTAIRLKTFLTKYRYKYSKSNYTV